MAASKGSHWTDGEIECLLKIWAEDGIQRELENTHKNSAVFRRIRDSLSRRGYVRSTEQCRNKVKKLRIHYKRVRDTPRKPGVSGRDKYRWYDAVDQIIGHRESCQAVVVGSPMEGPSADEGLGPPADNVFVLQDDVKPTQDDLLFLIKTVEDDRHHGSKSGPSETSNDEQRVGVFMSDANTSASETDAAVAAASPPGVTVQSSSAAGRRRKTATGVAMQAFLELQKKNHEDFMAAEKERQRHELDMFAHWMREQRHLEERRQQESQLMFQQLLSFLQRPTPTLNCSAHSPPTPLLPQTFKDEY